MRLIFSMLVLTILYSCSSYTTNNADLDLDVDIYKKDMTFEKFKQEAIEYADKSLYPSLIKND